MNVFSSWSLQAFVGKMVQKFQDQETRHQAVRLGRTNVVGTIQRRKSLLRPIPTGDRPPIQFMARIQGSVKRKEKAALRHVVKDGFVEKRTGNSGVNVQNPAISYGEG